MKRQPSPATGRSVDPVPDEAPGMRRVPPSLRKFAKARETPAGPHPGGVKPRCARQW